MLQNVFDRVLTGVTKRAAEVQAAASKQGQESLHTQAFANRAHAAGECKTRTAQKAHVESAKVHAQRLIDSGGEQTEIMKRDVLGNLLTVVQDSQHPGDWAIRACLNYMNSPNSMTKGLALLTHAKLLDLMPPEKRSSELLAAVQTVATSLRSMDEIEVQYALKYISSCWDADLVPNIIGQPGQPRKTGGSSAPENITLLSILLPDMSEARKPALASPSTIKHTLAAFTSLVQRFREQVESCIDLLDVTNSICKRHMPHGVLGLPTANLLRVVVSRCAAKGQLAAASVAFLNTTVTALESARSCTPLPHYKMQALAGALSTLCVDSVNHQAANALGSAMDAAMAHTGLSDDHEMASAYGTLSQCVVAVSKLPPGAPRVPDLHRKAVDVTRHMFNRAKSTKPSQWRNPNNLHFEALRCIVALQACKPSVATPFREEIVHCLRSTDASLRYLAADVLYNSCSADNLSSVAEQFLLIIRSSSEDSIRASYSTKVAQLVETYAQPAEYARTMAAVLVAAGNAAPRALASRISGTLALCGEQTVQANTASVFSQLLKAEDPLSDAQLLALLMLSLKLHKHGKPVQVAFWVVAEYGDSAGISTIDNVKSIIRVCTRQRLSHEQEAAALTALFKIAAKAGASAGALQVPLAGFLKAREASMDIMVARLASFTSSAIRQPGSFMKVITPADQVSAINQQSDVDLSNLAALAAEQRAQGQAGYTEPDERFSLFTPAMVAPAQPSLRTEQYASPSTSPALPGVRASPAPHTSAAMSSSSSPSPQQAVRAARPPPRSKPSRGTFSNMMMGPDPAAAQPPAPAPAAAASASAAPTTPPAAVHRDCTPTPEKDSLADMLFGGSGGGASPMVNAAKSSPAPAPVADLLGDFGIDTASPAPAVAVGGAAAGGGFADLLGGEASSPAATNDDPLAALSGLSMRETKPSASHDVAVASGDPFADFTAVAAPGPGMGVGHAVDLASDLDMLSDPMPVVSTAAVGNAQPPVDPLQSLLGTGVPATSAQVTSNYAVPPPLPVGPVPYRQNAGVPGWPMVPDASAATAMSGEQDLGVSAMPQDSAKPQGKLNATAPKKKGDAFADLLDM